MSFPKVAPTPKRSHAPPSPRHGRRSFTEAAPWTVGSTTPLLLRPIFPDSLSTGFQPENFMIFEGEDPCTVCSVECPRTRHLWGPRRILYGRQCDDPSGRHSFGRLFGLYILIPFVFVELDCPLNSRRPPPDVPPVLAPLGSRRRKSYVPDLRSRRGSFTCTVRIVFLPEE